MSLPPIVVQPDVQPQRPRPVDTLLAGPWLVIARVMWVVLAVLTLAAFGANLPNYFALLHTVCAGNACASQQLSPALVGTLLHLGFSVADYAMFSVVCTIVLTAVWVAIGAVIFWHASSNWMALLTSLMLVTFGTLYASGMAGGSDFTWLLSGVVLTFLAYNSLFLVFFLFPDGLFVPRWTRWIMIALLTWKVLVLFPFFPTDPPYSILFYYLPLFSFFGSSVVAQVYRYLYVSNPVQRQQAKWVVFGLTTAFVVAFGFYLPSLIFPSLPQQSLLYFLANTTALYFFLLPIPLSFGMAILRYRLWDIDIIINRTLVYGALTISIIGIYILIVGLLSALFQSSGNLVISLVATGLVAVLFQPLRERLQCAANRFIYGERDNPYAVLSRLGRRLEATLAPEAVLPTIVETVAQALKLPYAAVTLKQGIKYTIVASYGSPRDDLVSLPLIYQTEPVGELLLAPRSVGEHFTPADRRLLDDLARQVGIAVHTVRLTTDLQGLARELQASRTQLVTAREEERRRLRRDLHDGLGSALTSMTFQLDAAGNVLDRDPQAVKTLLKELKIQTQASIADIRRLVYNLRPPILDEWGLVAALREQVAQFQLNDVQVTVDAPESLPALPAAVEVAAYRIALEALANVIRHARASTCTICLALCDDALTVEVKDDGCGLPRSYHAGVGINAMRERAAELGGSCVVETMMSGGTCVSARLLLLKE